MFTLTTQVANAALPSQAAALIQAARAEAGELGYDVVEYDRLLAEVLCWLGLGVS